MELNDSVQYLPGVGPKMADRLKRLGIETVRDLLFYFPRRWDDFSVPRQIAGLSLGDEAIIKAKIFQIKQTRTRRKWMSLIEATLVDDSGEIKAIWFNQPFLLKVLKPGDEFLFAGKVNFDFKVKKKILAVTQYEKNPCILPVYSETEGVTSKYLRRLVQPLIGQIDNLIDDYLPEKIIKDQNLIDLRSALKKIHFPQKSSEIGFAKKRLGFDELFMIALKMLVVKKELSKSGAIALRVEPQKLRDFVEKLPFKLTDAQRKSAWEIIKDLSQPSPMNRLLEGDVGSGKTIVAAMAVLVTAENGYQSVWLAPTEILANQHYKNVSKIFKPFKIKVGLLTSAAKKADLKKDNLIIGTHALLQKDISFPNLALIVVDEQHRFGVKQRAHLRQTAPAYEMGANRSEYIPHLLSMTATPIPRTLALSLYGDLDLSIIDEMPPGRQKVITKVVSPKNRPKAYDFIRKQVKLSRQVFVICPLIEPSDKMINLFEADKKSVITEYEKLSKNIFPDLKIGLLHGKLKSKEKEKVMRQFQNNKLDILVSTAVVEVGIDIPNATVMMVEGAERFGLAQLHQFRGRVGRGKHQSYCFLFSESWSQNTKSRLEAMIHCHSGFELAEKDLQIRGPGELAGLRQSGLPDLKMASLSDIILIEQARALAKEIIKTGLSKYPQIAQKLKAYESERHLE